MTQPSFSGTGGRPRRKERPAPRRRGRRACRRRRGRSRPRRPAPRIRHRRRHPDRKRHLEQPPVRPHRPPPELRPDNRRDMGGQVARVGGFPPAATRTSRAIRTRHLRPGDALPGQVSAQGLQHDVDLGAPRPKPPLAHSGGSPSRLATRGHGLMERPGHRGAGHLRLQRLPALLRLFRLDDAVRSSAPGRRRTSPAAAGATSGSSARPSNPFSSGPQAFLSPRSPA